MEGGLFHASDFAEVVLRSGFTSPKSKGSIQSPLKKKKPNDNLHKSREDKPSLEVSLMLTFGSRIGQLLFYDTEWIPRNKKEWSLQELKDWRILKQNKNSLLFAEIKQEVQGLSGHTPWGSTQGVPVFWKTCLFWSVVELNGTWFTSYFPQTSHQIEFLMSKSLWVLSLVTACSGEH